MKPNKIILKLPNPPRPSQKQREAKREEKEVQKREEKEAKSRKEGPNPAWDRLQRMKVREVKCEKVKMYPSHLPYALVYVFA
jgi:hypothetical protein